MQSTSAAIAAAAASGADLGAKAKSAKGSDAVAKRTSTSGALGANGFDVIEAEAWLQNRWKAIQAAQKPEVYIASAGATGSAWGPNKKTVNERFAADLLKASTAAAASTKK